jgi:hypothetical protein
MRGLCVLVGLLACGGTGSEPVAGSGSTAAPSDAAARTPDAATAGSAAEPDKDGAQVRKIHVDKIPDAATFEAYSKEVGGERFAKFVLDMKTNAIYYFDVSIYPVHKDFIFGALYKQPKTKEAVRLVDRNYGANKPDFMMCYVVHHLNQDQWTFAFWDGDLATSAHVRRAYARIKETFYLADKIRFRPDSNYQERIAKATKDVPFVLNDELYKLADYTAFNKGVAVGKLRIVPADVPESDLTFSSDEIVVLRAPLSDITPVAGIISETFSTPLSHLALRSRGWGIPNIGLRDAQKQLADLADKIVYFEAKDVGRVIRAATDAEIAAAKARAETRAKVKLPKADLAFNELTTLAEMRAKDANKFGPKSANLGEIIHAKRSGFEVPPGFGIPFHYYRAHLEAAGIDKMLTELLADPDVAKDANVRKRKLEALRKAIETAPLSEELRTKVADGLAALAPPPIASGAGTAVSEGSGSDAGSGSGSGSDAGSGSGSAAPPPQGVFVRSSTNAEDLDNFSGAGLHDTKPNVRGLDAVCDAIKAVWASTWTLRAFDARLHAGIDQTKVYGSALVQVGVPATAAGVVATVHPSDPTDEKNYTINAKSGLGMAVVDGRKVPESLIVSWYNRGIRVLSRSDEPSFLVFDDSGGVREVPNPHKGKPVLSNSKALHLARVARDLTKLFKNPKLDIEWVYVGDQLYIVQTRPLVGH